MAAAIKGKQIIWGVPSAVVTAALVAATGGIVTDFEHTAGGATDTVADEDNDIVTRIDHGAENKISLTVDCMSTTTKPAKGTELTGLGTIDGVNYGTGRVFVDDSKVVYNRAGVKKLTVTATHYPAMVADA